MPRTALDSIGRLPEHARDEISRAIADGKTWRQIAKICEGHGLKGVQAQNVTNYKKGKKHKEWVAKQERMAVIRMEQAEGRDIFDAALEGGMNPAEAACLLASRKMLATMKRIDLDTILDAAVDDPALNFRLIKMAQSLAGTLKPGKAQAAAKETPIDGALNPEEKTRKMKEFFGAA
jgi:hypothetical protein